MLTKPGRFNEVVGDKFYIFITKFRFFFIILNESRLSLEKTTE